MPEHNEASSLAAPMRLAREKLQAYLELSQAVSEMISELIRRLNQRLSSPEARLNLRESVLVGLALKACGCFECLVADARAERYEASHHLKTLVETFIYFHWVGADSSDQRALLVRADAYHSMARYHENNPSVENSQHLAEKWHQNHRQAIVGVEGAWDKFKGKKINRLASECGLTEYYRRVYKMACQAAHLADLYTYTPPYPEGTASTTPIGTSTLGAYVCLDYGLHVIADLLRVSADFLGMGADERILTLPERMAFIRSRSRQPQ